MARRKKIVASIALAVLMLSFCGIETMAKNSEHFEKEMTVTYVDSETGEIVEQKITGKVVGWSLESDPKKRNEENTFALGETMPGKKLRFLADFYGNTTYGKPAAAFGRSNPYAPGRK